MDMPSGCVNCPLYDYEPSICFIKDKFQNDISKDFKPTWCPLKPMPHKKEREVVEENYNGGYSHGIVHGYNACIDELLSEKE